MKNQKEPKEKQTSQQSKKQLSTREQRKRISFLHALEKTGGNIKQACEAEKVCRQTYYNWCKSDFLIPCPLNKKRKARFSELVDELMEGMKDNAESSFYQNVLRGSVPAQIFYLKTRCKDRGYTEKTEIEHSMKDKIILDAESAPSDEALFQILKAIDQKNKKNGFVPNSKKQTA